MVEDKELIRQYAAERSETAFAELVRRHLNMVYGAALRQVNGSRRPRPSRAGFTPTPGLLR
jgi:DNA-binding GntR family transcriptional regulator